MKPRSAEASHLIRSTRTFSMTGEDFCQLLSDVLRRGTIIRFRTKGSSMYPFIKDGDVVTIKPIGKTKPRVGKVIAFIHPNSKRVILHRIVKKKMGHYITKGDNALERDGRIPAPSILGLVSRVERNKKSARLGLGPERYFIAFIGKHKFLQKGLRSLIKISLRKKKTEER